MADDDGSFLSRRLRWRRVDPAADGAVTRSPAEIPTPRRRYDLDFWDDDPIWPDDLLAGRSAPVDAAPAGPSFERRDLERIDEEALDRRRQLWRDTAVILSALVAVLLAANVVLPQLTGLAVSGSGPPSDTPPAGASPVGGGGSTAAPSAPPSAPVARPTRAPSITLPPTGTSAPPHAAATPRPTPRPTRTPAPPTAQPTGVPTAQPTEAPQDTPPPTPGDTPPDSPPPGP